MEQQPDPHRALVPIVPDTTTWLGIGRTSVYRLIDEGHLKTVSIGRRRLVTVESIEGFVRRLKEAA